MPTTVGCKVGFEHNHCFSQSIILSVPYVQKIRLLTKFKCRLVNNMLGLCCRFSGSKNLQFHKLSLLLSDFSLWFYCNPAHVVKCRFGIETTYCNYNMSTHVLLANKSFCANVLYACIICIWIISAGWISHWYHTFYVVHAGSKGEKGDCNCKKWVCTGPSWMQSTLSCRPFRIFFSMSEVWRLHQGYVYVESWNRHCETVHLSPVICKKRFKTEHTTH